MYSMQLNYIKLYSVLLYFSQFFWIAFTFEGFDWILFYFFNVILSNCIQFDSFPFIYFFFNSFWISYVLFNSNKYCLVLLNFFESQIYILILLIILMSYVPVGIKETKKRRRFLVGSKNKTFWRNVCPSVLKTYLN